MHRPRYDDWSLPKGKLDPTRGWEAAARREVQEEVGLRCRLGAELPAVGYSDHKGRAKAVRYWLMEARGRPAPFMLNDEVDEMRWLDVAAAAALLSYPHDAELVRAAGRAVERDRSPAWPAVGAPGRPRGHPEVDAAIDAMAAWMRPAAARTTVGVRGRPGHRCVRRGGSRDRGAAARGRAAGRRVRPRMTAMTMRLLAAVGRTLGAGRRGRGDPPGPRRQRAPWVIAAERAGATVRWGSPTARRWRCRLRGRGGAVGAQPLGRGDRRVERGGNGAGARRDRRRRPRGRARRDLRRRGGGPRRPGRSTLARARRRHPRLLGLQVVRPAHRDPVREPALLEELQPDKWRRRPTRRPTGSSSGRSRSSRSPASLAAAEYLLDVGFEAIRSHEDGLMALARSTAWPRSRRDALRRPARPRPHPDVQRRGA